MDRIRVIYEHDDDTWVATSPEVPNWTVVADTYEEAHRLAEEGVRFEPSPDSGSSGALPVGSSGDPAAPALPPELAGGLSIGESPAVSPDFSLERLQALLTDKDENRLAAGFIQRAIRA